MEEVVDFHMDLELLETKASFVKHLGTALDILVVADCSLDKVLLLLLPEMEASHMEHMAERDSVVGLCSDTVDRLQHQKELIGHTAVNPATVDHIDLLP